MHISVQATEVIKKERGVQRSQSHRTVIKEKGKDQSATSSDCTGAKNSKRAGQ